MPAKSWANDGADALRYLAHAVESGLVYLDRVEPVTSRGATASVWNNSYPEEYEEPRRNPAGGLYGIERKYTLEEVRKIDPVTKKEVVYYR